MVSSHDPPPYCSSHLLTSPLRNFIWEEKYQNKDPDKYHRLKDGVQSGEDTDSSLDHLTHRFNRGMNKLMHFGHDEDENQEERRDEFDGSNTPRIQLTRR